MEEVMLAELSSLQGSSASVGVHSPSQAAEQKQEMVAECWVPDRGERWRRENW